jgi:hypothetical protein
MEKIYQLMLITLGIVVGVFILDAVLDSLSRIFDIRLGELMTYVSMVLTGFVAGIGFYFAKFFVEKV